MFVNISLSKAEHQQTFEGLVVGVEVGAAVGFAVTATNTYGRERYQISFLLQMKKQFVNLLPALFSHCSLSVLLDILNRKHHIKNDKVVSILQNYINSPHIVPNCASLTLTHCLSIAKKGERTIKLINLIFRIKIVRMHFRTNYYVQCCHFESHKHMQHCYKKKE